MLRKLVLAVLLVQGGWIEGVGAQAAAKELEEEQVPDKAQPPPSFWSYFGAGLLVAVYPRKDIVEAAEIRDGIVRVTERKRVTAGLGLQGFFPIYSITWLRTNDPETMKDEDKKWFTYSNHSVGIYAGAVLSEELVDTIALGIAYSGRRRDGGIRIGAGAVVDPDARLLAPDFTENESAPEGATDVKTLKDAAFGFQVMLTFTPGFSD